MSKQISLRIPENLYDRIEKTNDKTTNVIIKALEQYFNESSNSNKEDKEEIIKILKEELQTSKKNYEDLKQIYHNYMVQMQAIIEQKTIEEPKNNITQLKIIKWLKFWK
ncbi:MAG: hypothetical protein BA871_03550 [Desulfuromonadales bacterium C00003096]|jgi:metal-responsive CopG/Arc/MetJ family transcriptional regulator|nr:MAG: hypothetical protein BA871_03550 [Desulfuromonadales bacterium C00003096]